MQETHTIDISGGVGVRFSGSIDRRLRPLNHQAAALKCPRCESLNTKFCYYNNYNLSQPRHFCKGCRRYWTKGGVLRSVPVGGGVRKTKRSAKAKSDPAVKESKSHHQSSSSESSSLTAATTATEPPKSAATGVAAVVVGGPVPSDTSKSEAPVAYNFPESRLYNLINPPSFDHQSTDGQIFPTDMGKFSNLMTSPEENMMSFGMRETKTASFQGPADENSGSGVADEFKLGNDGLGAAMDWAGGGDGGDQGLFDPAYWNHQPHEWSDNDHSLNYLP